MFILSSGVLLPPQSPVVLRLSRETWRVAKPCFKKADRLMIQKCPEGVRMAGQQATHCASKPPPLRAG